MSATTLIAILALVGFALYRQTRTHELTGAGRYKLALIYAIVGICIGVGLPHNTAAYGLFAISLLASVAVGWLRGQRMPIWQDVDGRTFTRGSAATIALFLGLVAFKFVLGTVAYLGHIPYPASIGEILLMIGLMLAMQAKIVATRAERLGYLPAGRTAPVAALTSR
jgi:hypothetical protein